MRSEDVIVHLKSIFARQGILELLITDNEFVSQQFTDFALSYGFKHLTSSPRFAQSNREAERHIKTVKCLLKKQLTLTLLSLHAEQHPWPMATAQPSF